MVNYLNIFQLAKFVAALKMDLMNKTWIMVTAAYTIFACELLGRKQISNN